MRDLSLKGRALVGVWLDTGLKSQGKGFGWGVVSAGLKSPFALSYGCVFFFPVFYILEIICTNSQWRS